MAWKRDSAYWTKRLQDERPEVWARVEGGEIASVRAGCIEAGFIRQPTALMALRREWKKATAAERKTFLDEVRDAA